MLQSMTCSRRKKLRNSSAFILALSKNGTRKKFFEPYLIDYHGNFYYTREQLEQLRSVYNKGWENIYKNSAPLSDFSDIFSGQNIKDSGSNLLCVTDKNEFKNILQEKLTNAFLALSGDSFHLDQYTDNAYAIVNNVKFSVYNLGAVGKLKLNQKSGK